MSDPHERAGRDITRVVASMLVAALGVAGLVGVWPASAATTTFASTVRVPIGQTTEPGDGSGMIAINDAPAGSGTYAAATPYPSVAPINGLVGTVSKVVLRINGFTHQAPLDVDVMLVAPDGNRVVVMSDVGGSTLVSNVNLVFDDSSSSYISTDGLPVVSGTYHPANAGVTNDAFPAPAPATPPTTSPSLADLNGGSPNGNWSLYVMDDLHIYSGSIFSWSITVTSTGSDNYPSTVDVTGVSGTVTDVNVRLDDLSHGYPEDVDLLLVGPAGQQATLLSDIPQSSGIEDVDLVFDDAAPSAVAKPIVSGTFRPTNLGAGADTFPAPAPPATGSTSLSVFNGTDPNGTWRLYAVDDGIGRHGGILGWSLDITTTDPAAPTPTPTPTASPDADVAHPRVTSTLPGPRATGVRRGADVVATVSEAVNPTTLTGARVYLQRKGSTRRVPATLTWRPGTLRIVIDPKRRLRARTTYRAVITTAVTDVAGNRLDQKPARGGLQQKTWRFTTR